MTLSSLHRFNCNIVSKKKKTRLCAKLVGQGCEQELEKDVLFPLQCSWLYLGISITAQDKRYTSI